MAPVLLLLATHFVLTLNSNQYEEHTTHKNVNHLNQNYSLINQIKSTQGQAREPHHINLTDPKENHNFKLSNSTFITKQQDYFKSAKRKLENNQTSSNLGKRLNYLLNLILLKLDSLKVNSSTSLNSQQSLMRDVDCSKINNNETSNKIEDSYGKQNRSIFLELIGNGLKLKSDVIKRAHSHTTNQSSDSAKDLVNGTPKLFIKYPPQQKINSHLGVLQHRPNIHSQDQNISKVNQKTKAPRRTQRNAGSHDVISVNYTTTSSPEVGLTTIQHIEGLSNTSLNCTKCSNATQMPSLETTSAKPHETQNTTAAGYLLTQNRANLSDLIFSSNGSNKLDNARLQHLNVSRNISSHDSRRDKLEKFIAQDTWLNLTDRVSDEMLITTIASVLSGESGSDKVNKSYQVKVKPSFPWPVKKEAIVEGDLVLGGLMMVHEREDSVTCGPVMPQGGIQALEAMLYTLDRLNEEPSGVLPNITLGAHILDDCDKDTYGLEMAVDFIKDIEKFSLTMLIFNFLTLMFISVWCGDDILSKFKQNDYKTKDMRAELESYDKNVYRKFEIKTFKYNRSTVAFNVSANLIIDLNDKLDVLVQVYKFASNEFREFPIRFQVNAVKMYDANVMGFQKLTKCGNIQSLYFLKDINYHGCNFVIDDSLLPPYMPTGIYKATGRGIYYENEIFVGNLYAEVYRPIYPPKRGH